MALSNNRCQREYDKFVADEDGNTTVRTTITGFDGDININSESNSVNTNGLVGKASGANADFTTTRTANTQFTCSSLPAGVTAINADDIVSVAQVTAAGSTTKIWYKDDSTITCSGTDPTTVTVAGATFGATDTLVVYTNIGRDTINDSVHAEDSVHTSGEMGTFALTVRLDTAASTAGSDGDYAGLVTDATGHLYTNDEEAVALLTTIDADTSKIPSQGTAVMTGSVPVTIATDDTMVTATNTALGTVNTNLGTIETDIEATNTALTTTNTTLGNIKTAVELIDNTVATIGTTDVQRVAIFNDANEQVLSFGSPSTISTHKSPNDFTATYTSNVTLTLAGHEVVGNNAQIVYIRVVPASGDAAVYVNGSGGVTMTYSANVITIAGAGTPFTAGDAYEVGINYQDKGFDAGLDVSKGIEQAPLNKQAYVESSVDTTNVAAGTNYYPSSDGQLMFGYKDLSLTGKFIDADGTITMTIEVTNDDDATPANRDWIQIYGYDVKNNTTTNSWTVTDDTLTFAVDFDNLNFKYYRVVMVNNGATNTAIIKQRLKAL
jgi:hypothetical protein